MKKICDGCGFDLVFGKCENKTCPMFDCIPVSNLEKVYPHDDWNQPG